MLRRVGGMLAIWRWVGLLALHVVRVGIHLLWEAHAVQRPSMGVSLGRVDGGRTIRLRSLVAGDGWIGLAADRRLCSHAFVRFCKAGQSQTECASSHGIQNNMAVNPLLFGGGEGIEFNWFQLT